MIRFLEINDNEDNMPVKLVEGAPFLISPNEISKEESREYLEKKSLTKKISITRKFSDDKKKKKNILKGSFI